jgi:hypothetical protein
MCGPYGVNQRRKIFAGRLHEYTHSGLSYERGVSLPSGEVIHVCC